MKTIIVNKENVEKLLHLIQEYSDDNHGGFDDAIDEIFPGLLPEYEKKPEPFEIKWE